MYCLTSSVGTPGVGVVADNLGAVATIASMTLGCGSTTFGGKPTMPKAGGTCAVVSATSASVNVYGTEYVLAVFMLNAAPDLVIVHVLFD